MSHYTDELVETVESLVRNLATGRKSIVIKTGVGGGKMLTIVDTPRNN